MQIFSHQKSSQAKFLFFSKFFITSYIYILPPHDTFAKIFFKFFKKKKIYNPAQFEITPYNPAQFEKFLI
jgi:hypothetical protein